MTGLAGRTPATYPSAEVSSRQPQERPEKMNDLEFNSREEFSKILERFEAWWSGGIVDRAPVTFCVPFRETPAPPPPSKAHASLRDRWLDIDGKLDAFEAGLEGARFVGESFPMFMPNVGPEVYATLFGAELEFSESTSWAVPSAASCRQIAEIEPDFENPYWQAVREGTIRSLQRGRGRWVTGVTDLHPNGDLLASLRDPQHLCIEMMDDPEGVRAACDATARHFPRIFEELWGPIREAGDPCTTWARYLSGSSAYAASCDFICMIGEEQFAETILPAIRVEMAHLDRTLFHLDGPGALRHLDALLAEDDLDAIQWVYGAGNEPAARWLEVYRRIQQAGKSMEVLAQDLDDARAVMDELRPEGVWLFFGGIEASADEAEAFLDEVARWSAGRR
jgi:hypothetical protein